MAGNGADGPPIDIEDFGNFLVGLPGLEGVWQEVRVAAGECLFEKGAEGDAFYAVLEGELEVYRLDDAGRRIVLERLGPGKHVGELALLTDAPRSASVAAVAPSVLERLPRREFLATLGRSPELSQMTVSLLAARMLRTSTYLDSLTKWARSVAEGNYDVARDSILGDAGRQADDNVARFLETFLDMVSAVQARESELRRELHKLRIEIDHSKSAQQVSEITESDFFRQLRESATELRRRNREGGTPD